MENLENTQALLILHEDVFDDDEAIRTQLLKENFIIIEQGVFTLKQEQATHYIQDIYHMEKPQVIKEEEEKEGEKEEEGEGEEVKICMRI